jgi:1-deoxy-D-xylulose-5-phosphate reductoisomerase
MSGNRQRLTILGSTGSIGVNTLDVVGRHRDRFEVFALTANTSVEVLAKQCAEFRPEFAVMADESSGLALQAICVSEGLPTRVLWGSAAIETVAGHSAVDMVMAAIVGAAGLGPCMAAARAGKRLLLANKEALVVGGSVFMQAVKDGKATLLPIDSEHSAIFQSLPHDPNQWPTQVDKIILTASGGPFRTRDPGTLSEVTPDQACAHPNWVMGRKISVDSATMMNKALEVIEARFLFGLAPAQIEVVIHPQSVVHSMVQYVDHSVVAQMGTPDMRGPIAYGLSWPDRIESGAAALDFTAMQNLTFESIHTAEHRLRFPGLALAWQVLNAPSGATAVLNAANEIAVAAFLDGGLRFDQIYQVNAQTLDGLSFTPPTSLLEILDLDEQARRFAARVVARMPR